MSTVTQQTLQLLPEYQERYLKDLLANVYSVDPETGAVSGIASYNPLMGQPVYQTDEAGNILTDAQGDPLIEFQRDAAGNILYDAQGQPMPMVMGGVPRPDVMPFTPAQQEAIRMGVEEGIGLYQPYLESAESAVSRGIEGIFGGGMGMAERGAAALAPTVSARYTPEMAQPYYNQYVEDVIGATQADIQRQADIERNRIGSAAVQAGAFGGSRQAVAEQELARNAARQMADTSAQLRSRAYEQAQAQGQSVFENAQQRGQNAAQLYGQLGQGIGALGSQGIQGGTTMGALGEAAQSQFGTDIDRLFNLGLAEQSQRQSEYDVQRAGAMEEAYEPYQRFAYMSDIFQGVPSKYQTLAVAPTPAPVSNILGGAIGFQNYRQSQGGTGILSGLM